MAAFDHYAGTAEGWAHGAARVYGPLADDLVAAAPHPLAGRLVLDAGAGTGLVSAALREVGARAVAVDLSLDMLRWRRTSRPPAVVGELGAIGLRTATVDDAVAAFVLNHLPDPHPALVEIRRVVRPGGAVLATVYADSSRSAARDRVDDVAEEHGFRFPQWYRRLKLEYAPRVGTADRMAAVARGAGLTAVDVVEFAAELGLDRAEDLVDYRYHQAHCREWISALSAERRTALRSAAITAIEPIMEPYRPIVLRLAATVP